MEVIKYIFKKIWKRLFPVVPEITMEEFLKLESKKTIRKPNYEKGET